MAMFPQTAVLGTVMAAVAGPFVETDHEKTIKLITAVKNAVHVEHKATR